MASSKGAPSSPIQRTKETRLWDEASTNFSGCYVPRRLISPEAKTATGSDVPVDAMASATTAASQSLPTAHATVMEIEIAHRYIHVYIVHLEHKDHVTKAGAQKHHCG